MTKRNVFMETHFFHILDDLTLEKETFLDFCDGDAWQTREII